MIAQEVEKVIPAVVRRGDQPADPLSIEYTALAPLLIRAVQTQQQIIADQAKRIAKLESSNRSAGQMLSDVTHGAAFASMPLLGFALLSQLRKRRTKSD